MGLRREGHAEDLLVDLTPPEILFVNDGIGKNWMYLFLSQQFSKTVYVMYIHIYVSFGLALQTYMHSFITNLNILR